jgi:hypothetical protein
LGLDFDDEDVEVVGLMSERDTIIRARYIATGFFRFPHIDALDRTCKSLRASVATEFRTRKIVFRLNKRQA